MVNSIPQKRPFHQRVKAALAELDKSKSSMVLVEEFFMRAAGLVDDPKYAFPDLPREPVHRKIDKFAIAMTEAESANPRAFPFIREGELTEDSRFVMKGVTDRSNMKVILGADDYDIDHKIRMDMALHGHRIGSLGALLECMEQAGIKDHGAPWGLTIRIAARVLSRQEEVLDYIQSLIDLDDYSGVAAVPVDVSYE